MHGFYMTHPCLLKPKDLPLSGLVSMLHTFQGSRVSLSRVDTSRTPPRGQHTASCPTSALAPGGGGHGRELGGTLPDSTLQIFPLKCSQSPRLSPSLPVLNSQALKAGFRADSHYHLLTIMCVSHEYRNKLELTSKIRVFFIRTNLINQAWKTGIGVHPC